SGRNARERPTARVPTGRDLGDALRGATPAPQPNRRTSPRCRRSPVAGRRRSCSRAPARPLVSCPVPAHPVPDPTHPVDAVYLHARLPSAARVAFWSVAGPEAAAAALPDDLRSALEPVDFEVVLPTEEASLRPIGAAAADRATPGERVVPGLWRIPG